MLDVKNPFDTAESVLSKEYPPYRKLSRLEMLSRIEDLMLMLKIPHFHDVLYDDELLETVIERVEMRRSYFSIYHAPMKMGELNETALYCFWILKLQPFRIDGRTNLDANAFAALNVLWYGISFLTAKTVAPTRSMLDHLFYSFRFHDLSKEAIMLLAEALLEPYLPPES
ncbi:hypothetical protein AGMMS49959_17220 [Planctomycetales bacterium]|nr:hypothetical protein AGMMS49959_17220 [Planctomycetales bacterium]